MINYKENKENNEELKKFIFILILINILTVIYFSMNIKLRNDEIWKLRVENEDLKEQICNKVEE